METPHGIFFNHISTEQKKGLPQLWDEFERLGALKVQNSQYFLEANNTTAEIKNHFADFIDDDDMLMVVKFSTRPSFTKALAGTNDWINTRF